MSGERSEQLEKIHKSTNTYFAGILSEGACVSDPLDVANIFANHFYSSFRLTDYTEDFRAARATEESIHLDFGLVENISRDYNACFTMEKLNRALQVTSRKSLSGCTHEMLTNLPDMRRRRMLDLYHQF